MIFLASDPAGAVPSSYGVDKPPRINSSPKVSPADQTSYRLAALQNVEIGTATAERRLRETVDGELLAGSASQEIVAGHLIEIDHAHKNNEALEGRHGPAGVRQVRVRI
ncbi:hypothetical protein ABWI00_21700 [Algihabitans albus]|uniref:hypothetical protein n=1 Tax=Algihabitans albus TaxID=2164067 RepID=UPI0035CFD1A4